MTTGRREIREGLIDLAFPGRPAQYGGKRREDFPFFPGFPTHSAYRLRFLRLAMAARPQTRGSFLAFSPSAGRAAAPGIKLCKIFGGVNMTKIETGAISKAELARHLGVARSRISAFVKRGLPVRPDGKIILADAVKWMRANCEQTARFRDRRVNKLINADADAGPEPAEAAALDDDAAVSVMPKPKRCAKHFWRGWRGSNFSRNPGSCSTRMRSSQPGHRI